jgi:hypothetical protein
MFFTRSSDGDGDGDVGGENEGRANDMKAREEGIAKGKVTKEW